MRHQAMVTAALVEAVALAQRLAVLVVPAVLVELAVRVALVELVAQVVLVAQAEHLLQRAAKAIRMLFRSLPQETGHPLRESLRWIFPEHLSRLRLQAAIP